jgi:T1SS-143 domain-containing protein
MNAPFVLAQLSAPSAVTDASKSLKLGKPTGGQAVTVRLDGATRLDFTGLGDEKLTFVRIGSRLIILFDNQSTVTVDPVFDQSGKPLADIGFAMGPDRVLTGNEFATLFPIGTDQSVLPAAGTPGAPSIPSGANFGNASIDALNGGNPLDLLGNEVSDAGFGATDLGGQNTTPIANGADTVLVNEDGLSEGNLFGAGDEGGTVTSVSGSLNVNFGVDTAGRSFSFPISQPGLAGLTSGGEPVQLLFTTINGQPALIGYIGSDPLDPAGQVFTITLDALSTISGTYTFTLLRPLDHPITGTEDTLTLTVSVIATDGSGDAIPTSISIGINDDTPVLLSGGTFATATLDDEGAADAASTVVSGSLGISFGSDNGNSSIDGGQSGGAIDGDRAVVFAPDAAAPAGLTAFGESVQYVLLGNGTVLVAYTGAEVPSDAAITAETAGENIVFFVRLSDQGQGGYEFTLVRPLDHDVAGVEDDLGLSFGYVATDGDGDPVVGSLSVTVNDDVPVFTSANVQNGAIDEEGLSGGIAGASGSYAGSDLDGIATTATGGLGLSWGADNANAGGSNDRSLAFAGIVEGSPIPRGVEALLSSNGETIFYHLTTIGGQPAVVGYTGESPELQSSWVFTVTLDDSTTTGSYTFTLLQPIDHPFGGTEDDLTLDFGFIATDSDGDSVTGSFNVSIDDDAPMVTGTIVTATADEDDIDTTSSLGSSPDDGNSDGSYTGSPQTSTGPASVTGSITAVVSFGADGLGANGGFSFTGNAAATLAGLGLSSKGATVRYIVNGDTLTAYVDVGTEGNGYSQSDRRVFTLSIDQTTGEYAFNLYDQLDHVSGNGQAPTLVSTVAGLSAIDFGSVLRATDADGDVVALTGALTITITDDIPVPVIVTTGVSTTIDETSGVQNDDVTSGLAALFASVSNPGADTDLGGPIYARNPSALVSISASASGADESATQTLSLRIEGANGTASGLTTTDGQSISLYAISSTLIVGRVGGENGPAAFAITIDQSGRVSIAQYLSLGHGNTGSADESVNLGNLISAVITATDFDGDTVLASTLIGTQIRFEDDGPRITGGTVTVKADEDDISNALSQGNSPNDGTADGSSSENSTRGGGDAATVTGSIGSLVSFGADGQAAGGGFGFASNAVATMTALGLSSKGGALSYVILGDTILAYVDNGNGSYSSADRPVFALQLNDSTGAFSFQLYDQLDHVAGNGQNTALRTSTGSIAGIDFGSIIDATDGDGDRVDLDGRLIVTVTDDVPEISIVTSGAVTIDESTGNQDDDSSSTSVRDLFNSVGNRGSDPDLTATYARDDVVNTSVSGGADDTVTTTLALRIDGGNGIDSGLRTTAGDTIRLYLENGLVVGRVGNSGGAAAFAVTIESNGNVSVAQFLSLRHSTTASNDESVDLAGKISAVLTATDHDGDVVSQSVSIGNRISFDDDGPQVGSNGTVLLDDDNLSGGNPGGVGDNPAPVNAIGTLNHDFGADGGAIAWLSSGAPSGFSYQLAGNNLQILQGTTLVVTVTLNPATGAYTVTQNAPVMHVTGGSENNQSFDLTYRVTDGDGDRVTGTLSINVDDDTPVVTGTIVTATADEDDIDTSSSLGTSPDDGNGDGSYTGDADTSTGPATVTGSIGSVVSFGADGQAAGGGFGFASNAVATMTALGLSSKGGALSYVILGDTILAYVDNGNGSYSSADRPVFALQLNDSTGAFSFQLYDQLDHVAGNGQNTALRTSTGSIAGIDFGSIIDATDGDGDRVDLDGRLIVTVTDDVPEISIVTSGAVTIDESTGNQDDDSSSTSVRDLFNSVGNRGSDPDLTATYARDDVVNTSVSGGADDTVTTTLALRIDGGNGIDSGLRTTAGDTIRLYLENGLVVGRVGNSGGAAAFAVTIESNGNVSVAQFLSLRHSTTASNDESVDLAGKISAVLTATDHDGDVVSQSVSIGNRISFDDDGPQVGSNGTVLLDDDNLSGGNPGGVGDNPAPVNAIGTLNHDFGADGGAIAWLSSGAPSGFSYQLAGNNLQILQGTTLVVTVTLNPATGAYTVTQNAPVMHVTGGSENNQSFDLTYRVTDGDGDRVNGTLSINVDDDTPVVTGTIVTATADEDDIDTSSSLGTSPDDGNGDGSYTGSPQTNTGPASVTGSIASVVSFGADGLGPNGGFSFTVTAAATLAGLGLSSKGGVLRYVVNGDTLTAYVDVGTQGNGYSQSDRRVFTLSIDQTTGEYAFNLYDQLDHVSGNGQAPTLVSTVAGLSAIDFGAVLRATDADGDVVALTGALTITITDDIPVPVIVTTGASTTIDETVGVQNDDVTSGLAALFASVSNPGADTDLGGPIYARNPSALVSISASASGADESATQTLSLRIEGANGMASGLTTTDGQSISLYAISSTLIVGRVGGENGPAAFAITIDQSGRVSIAQYLSLHHGNTGSADESVNLGNLISAVDTATDFDGDTVLASTLIGSQIRFEDDGPRVTSNLLVRLDEDVLPGGNAGGNQDDVDAVAQTGTLAHEGGADGTASVLWSTAGVTLPSGFWFAVSAGGTVMTITQDQGNGYVPVLTLTITDAATGAYSVAQVAPIDHPQGTIPGTEDNVQFTVSYVVTDGDGDTAIGTISVNVDDDTPTVAANALIQLDDDALGGNAGGIGDEVETAALTGVLSHSGGADGTASVLWAPNGLTLPFGFWFELSPDSRTMTITQNQNGTYVGVFRATITDPATGDYQITQLAPVIHNTPGTEDNAQISFQYRVTDGDGDVATGTLTVNVDDDTPTASPSTTVWLDDDDLSGGNPGGISDQTGTPTNPTGMLNHSFGADSDGASMSWLASSSSNADSLGFTYEVTNGGNTLLVRQGATLVFTATMNQQTGAYAITQNATIDHPAGGDENEVVFQLRYLVTDGDGDTAQSYLWVKVDDDTPTGGAGTTAWLDDDSLTGGNPDGVGDNALANTSNVLKHSFGADGPGGITWTGIAVTSGGNQADFSSTVLNDGKTLQVYQNGTLVITATLNPLTGQYSLVHNASIDHVAGGDENQIQFQFLYDVTDGDGDTAAGYIWVNVDDDTPTGGAGTTAWLDDDSLAGGNPDGVGDNALANTSNVLKHSFGADGPGGITWTGIAVTSGGNQADFSSTVLNDGKTLQVYQNGTLVITATLNPLTGQYSLVHNASIDHVAGGDENQIQFQFLYDVTDGDGDTAAGYIWVNVDDDTPVLTQTYRYNDVFEAGVGGASGTDSSNFAISYGADGYGATAFTGAIKLDIGPGLAGNVSFDLANGDYRSTQFTSDGRAITFSKVDDNTIRGFVASADNGGQGNETIFEITLTDTDSSARTTLYGTLDHIAAGDGSVLTSLLVDATVRFTDGDGDSVTGIIRTSIKDDTPVSTGAVTAPTVLDDDAQPLFTGNDTPADGIANLTTATGGAGALFAIGADGLKSVTLGATTAFSAIYKDGNGVAHQESVSWGAPVVNGGATIWTATGSVSNAAVATLTIHADGSYSFTALRPLVHPTPGTTEENLALTFAYTVTDGDNDTATGSLTVNVNDDAPRLTQTLRYNDVLESGVGSASGTHSSNFAVSYGADGYGATAFTGAIKLDIGPGLAGNVSFDLASGNHRSTQFTSDGRAITFSKVDDNTIRGFVASVDNGGQGNETIFEITLTDTDSSARTTLYGNLDHIAAQDGSAIASLVIDATVRFTDGDGDAVTGIIRSNIMDDAPTAADVSASTDENQTVMVALDFAYGADSPGTVTFGTPVASDPSFDLSGLGISLVGSSVQIVPGTTFDSLAVGQTATLEIPYTVTDGDQDSVTRTVSVTITGANDAPEISAASVTATVLEPADVAGIVEAGAGGGLEPVVALSGAALTLVNGLQSGVDAASFATAFAAVLAQTGGNQALAIATLWDALDDAYGAAGPNQININESFTRLGMLYAEYLQDGGMPLTEVTAKFTADNNNDGIPQRQQSLHDNLLGNLTAAALQQRYAVADPTLHAELTAAITAIDTDLLTRPYFEGSQGQSDSAVRAWDLANGFIPSASGSIGFGDVDLTDSHTVSAVPQGANYLGSFTAAIGDASTGDGTGSIVWTFTVDPSAINYLAAGQTLTQTYTITVDDGHGGTDTVPVTITITGTNDAPTISAAAPVSTISEDPASNPGTLVSTLLGNAADVDGSVNGIAVVGQSVTGGHWQYSSNGGSTWNSLTTDPQHALVLGLTALVRFVPDLNVQTTTATTPPTQIAQPSLTFHAWDGSSGHVGDVVDLSVSGATGGGTAYSAGTGTSVLTISNVVDHVFTEGNDLVIDLQNFANDPAINANWFEDGNYLNALGGDDIVILPDSTDALYSHFQGQTFAAGAGNDSVTGGDAADHIRGGTGDDSLAGMGGADILEGGTGDDFLSGGTDNDRLFGGADDDTLGGGSGNDFLQGNAGDDVLNGGSGIDTADYATHLSAANFSYNQTEHRFEINAAAGGEGADQLHGIEVVTTPSQTFLLVGGAPGDTGFATISEAMAYAATVSGPVTILVAPGTYNENVVINRSDLTLLSLDGRGTTSILGQASGPETATITVLGGLDNVRIGADGKGFTIVGFDQGNPAIENAAVYVRGSADPTDGFELVGNDVRANGDLGLLSDWNAPITNAVIGNNIFSGQTFTGTQPGGPGNQFTTANSPRQLVAFGQGSDPATNPADNIQFTDNQITGTAGGVNANGEQGNTLVTIDASNSVISSNSFTGFTNGSGYALRVRGEGTSVLNNNVDHDVNNSESQGFFVDNHGVDGSYSGNIVDGGPAPEILFGTPGNDDVSGDAGNDAIAGGAGNDGLSGEAGNDVIAGGDGDDSMVGGSGIDSSADRLIGGAGSDALYGNEFEPVPTGENLVATAGEDDRAVYAGSASDYAISFNSGLGAWQVTAQTTAPEYDAGGGNTDTLYGIEGIDFGNNGVVDLDLTLPVVLLNSVGELIGTYLHIQDAVDAAGAVAGVVTILVGAGTYNENVVIDRGDLILRSMDGRDATSIVGQTSGSENATITVLGGLDNVKIGGTDVGFTIVGFDRGNPAIENAAVYLLNGGADATNNFELTGNDVRANGDLGLLSDWNMKVTNAVISDNIFSGVTFQGTAPGGPGDQWTVSDVPRQLVAFGQGSDPATNLATNILFTNNQITGTAGGLNGANVPTGNTLVTIDASNSFITNNLFTGFTTGGGYDLRVRGKNTDLLNNSADHDDTNSQGLGFLVVNHGEPGNYTDNVVDGGAASEILFGTPGGDDVSGDVGDDAIVGGAGDDLLSGYDGNDTFYELVGDGRDTVDGNDQTGADTYDLTGTTAGENFFVEIPADYVTRTGGSYAGSAEILVSNGAGIEAELTNIEEIVIHGGGGADTLTVSGSFTGTALLTSTITFDGGEGDDTIDVSDRTSSHRVVSDGGNGNDSVEFGFDYGEATYTKIFAPGTTTLIGVQVTHGAGDDQVTDVFTNYESFNFGNGETRTLAQLFAPVVTSAADGSITEDYASTIPTGDRVANGSFEGLSGWTRSNIDLLGVSHTGSTSVGAYLTTGTVSQTLQTVAGVTYNVRFWASNPYDNGLEVESLAVNWGGQTVFALGNLPPSGAYGNFTEYSFNVVATTASTAFSIAMLDTQGWWVLDDVSVRAVVDTTVEIATGTIGFTDTIGESHSVTYTPADGGYYGTFTPTLTNAATDDGTGTITWNFSVNNADIQHLAAGQTLTQTYTVRIDDGLGGVTTQDIDILLNGTNDAPVAVGETVQMIGTGAPPPTATSTPIFNEAETNNSRATANVIDRALLNVAPNSNLTDATDPSITVRGSITDSNKDYFAITLKAGETLILDIDNTSGSLDTVIRLFSASGTELKYSDDEPKSVGNGGSTDTNGNRDSYLIYTATTDGTYFIEVGRYPSFTSPTSGNYELQVSIDNFKWFDGPPLTISASTLLANDYDVDNGDTFTIVSVSGAGVALVGNNVVVQPGVTSFTYTVRDSHGAQSTATVQVDQVVNQAPSAVAFNNATTSIAENTSTAGPIKVADIAVTDDALGSNALTLTGADAASFQIIGNALYLKAGVSLDYETNTSYNVTVNVDDPTVGATPDLTRNFTLTVTDVNEAPVSADSIWDESEPTAGQWGNFLVYPEDFSFIDAEDNAAGLNEPAAVRIVSLPDPQFGTVLLDGVAVQAGAVIQMADIEAGKLVVHLVDRAADYAVTFQFQVIDSEGGSSATQTYAVNVDAVNDAPTTSAVTLTAASEDSGPLTITQAQLLANANDVDSATLSATNLVIATGGGALVNNGDGTWTYTPAGNDDTAVTFSYKITDGTSSVNGSASLDLTPVADAPSILSSTPTTMNEDQTVTLKDVSFADPDLGDIITVTLTAPRGVLFADPLIGVVIGGTDSALTLTGDVNKINLLVSTGRLHYTTAANDGSDVTIDVSVSDGATTTTGSFIIAVTPVADAPEVTSLLSGDTLAPTGDAFLLNTTTGGYQSLPSVAAIAGGGYVAAWQSSEQGGDAQNGIFLQRFDANGGKLGGEVHVNTVSADDQQNVEVAVLASGKVVVTWESYSQDGSAFGIYARIYNADGSAASTGEFLVNSSTATNQRGASITALDAGGFVIAWESAHDYASSGYNVYFQRFDANGNKVGGEILANTLTGADQTDADVTALSGGSFLVSWSSQYSVDNEPNVKAQILAADGSKIGPEFLLNTTTGNLQEKPAVAALNGGGFVAVWESPDGNGDGIFGQRFDATGAKVGGEFRVNTTVAGHQEWPTVIGLSDGGFLVSWSDEALAPGGIYAQRYDATGHAVGNELRLSDGGSVPALTELASGDILVAWYAGSGTATDSYGRILSLGQVTGSEDHPVTLPVTVALIDTDGSEVLDVVRIEGLPAGFTLAVGAREGDTASAWIIDRSTVSEQTFLDALAAGTGQLVLQPATDYSGHFTATVTATSREVETGATATSGSIALPVTITPVNDGTATLAIAENTAPMVGDVLQANLGPDPDGVESSIVYHWLRDGTEVSSGSSSSYTLGANDVGHQISAFATYKDGQNFVETTTTTAQTAAVLSGNDAPDFGSGSFAGSVTEQAGVPPTSALVNGGFEAGSSGWTSSSSQGGHNFGSGFPGEGTQNFKANSFGLYTAVQAELAQTVSTLPGVHYTLSFSVATTSQTPDAHVYVNWNGVQVLAVASGQASWGGYSTFTATVVGTGSDTLQFTIDDANNPPTYNSWNLDAVALTPATHYETTSGTIAFSDADVSDVHSVMVTPVGNNYIGNFVPTVVEASHQVKWTFYASDSALQALPANSIDQIYTLTIADGHGGFDTQDVTVTLVRHINSAPVITSSAQTGSVTEDASIGVINLVQNPTFELPNIYNPVLTPWTVSGTGASIGGSGANGSVDAVYLNPHSSISQTLTTVVGTTYTINYFLQNYGTPFSVMVNGTPVWTTSNVVSNWTEYSVTFTASSTSTVLSFATTGVNGASIDEVSVQAGTKHIVEGIETNTGTITYIDADVTNTHTVTASGPTFAWSGGTLSQAQIDALTNASTLTLNATENAGTGSVAWKHSIADSAIQFLAEGQTLIETYTVTIDDGRGGTTSQNVTITINGTNEAPTVGTDLIYVSDGTNVVIPWSSLLGNDTDADGDTLTITSATALTGISGSIPVTIDAVNRTVTFTVPSLSGNDTTGNSFQYTVTDGHGHSQVGTVNVAAIDTLDSSAVSYAIPAATYATSYLDGHGGDDSLTGGASSDILIGGAGSDTLNGNNGNDILIGGADRDTLNGGAGSDTFVVNAIVGSSSDSARVTNSGGGNDTGQDTIQSFSLTEDTIRIVATNVNTFAHGTDTAVGTAGSGTNGSNASSYSTLTGLIDLNHSGAFNDSGDVVVSFSSAPTGWGANDTARQASFESALQYELYGTSNGDAITGGSRDDYLSGQGGADTLSGGGGNDVIWGGTGNDTLRGGSGADTFKFGETGASNLDTIFDYVAAENDVIDLSALLGPASGAAANGSNINDYVKLTQTGTDILVQVDVNGTAGGSSFTDVALLSGYGTSNADLVRIAFQGHEQQLSA